VLADQKGSPNCSYTIFSGSLYKISWTHDSTKIAAAGALGCIIFADVNGRHIENNNYDITILDDGKVKVYNVSKDFSEDIYISKDRVIDVCVNEEWLLIITSSQCYIYNLSNLNTPYIINLRVNPLTAQISKSNFMILDQVEGIQIFSFEGKNISNPKHPNVRFESLNCNTTSVTSNIVFVIDSMEFKTVFAFDVITGKEISKFSHTSDISKISAFEQISELYEPNQCIIVFLDINKDLYLVQLKLKPLRNQISSKSIKLQGNIDSFKLDIYYNTLVGLTLEGQILVWYHPSVVFIDKELLSISRTIIDASQYGRGLRLINYTGTRIQIRKQDGCIEYIVVPQYFPLLFEYCRESMWNESVMLCRNQKNSILWGTLASYSLLKKQYAIAEIAFCEVNDVAKVIFIQSDYFNVF
jgi:intraflagellar transport protein 80